MTQSVHLDFVNLVGIDFVDEGKSLRLEVVDSIPPHDVRFLTFKNAFSIRLCQSRDDGFPFVLCELTWRLVEPEEMGSILAELAYPFFDSNGVPLLHDEPLVVARLEGAMVGSILAEEVVIQTSI